jgi:branched-chain amino acid transport system substrate-binding protein
MIRSLCKTRGLSAGLLIAGLFTFSVGIQASGSASAASKPTYLVGVPMPMTGAEAQQGTEIFDGEALAVAQINKAGGLLGHKIVLNEQDDACDPQTAVSANNLLVSKGVKAVVGDYCSGTALVTEPIISKAKLPLVLPDANSPTLTSGGFKNVFLIDPSSSGDATEAATFFKNVLHETKIAIVDDQSSFAVSVAQLAQTDIQKDGGTVAGSIQAVPPTTTDFSSVIAAIQGSGAKGIYWTGYYSQAALFAKQLEAAGLIGQGGSMSFVVADSSVDPTFISGAGAAATGTYATIAVPGQFLKGSKANQFNAAYKKAYHSAPGPYSAYGYDSIQVLAQAARNAKSLTPTKVTAALHKIRISGLTGTISFAANGSRQGCKFVVLTVANGNYVLAPKQP